MVQFRNEHELRGPGGNMSIQVTIGTTGPHESRSGEQGRRVRSCLVAAVPRIGEFLEMDSSAEWGRYTVTEVRHRPKSADIASDLNSVEDNPDVHIEAIAWEVDD
jgi:hypothetical protein